MTDAEIQWQISFWEFTYLIDFFSCYLDFIQDKGFKFKMKYLSDSLISSSGEQWKRGRSMMSPTFSGSKMKQVLYPCLCLWICALQNGYGQCWGRDVVHFSSTARPGYQGVGERLKKLSGPSFHSQELIVTVSVTKEPIFIIGTFVGPLHPDDKWLWLMTSSRASRTKEG